MAPAIPTTTLYRSVDQGGLRRRQVRVCGAGDAFIHGLVELHAHLGRLLLTVEDTFAIKGRGLVLAPFLPVAEARPAPFAVELHRPDRSIVWANALVQVPFVHPTPEKADGARDAAQRREGGRAGGDEGLGRC